MKDKNDGDRHFTEDVIVAEIFKLILVLQARAKMAEDESQRAEDSIVSVMIKQLPQEKTEEIRRCFQDRFMVLKDAPRPLEHGEAGHPAEA